VPKTGSPHGNFAIPSLDGLRAVSFLLVFFGHSGVGWIPGGFGVTVFFFLSGYLITTLLRLEQERTGRVDLRMFYLRRALRIWPPFYIVLLGGVALTQLGVIEATLHAPSVLAQVFHVSNYWVSFQNWRGVVPGSGVYWSLAVEEHFYLIFPALFMALQRAGASPRQQVLTFAAISAAVLAWRCVLSLLLDASFTRTFVCTDTRLDSLLFGCALAVYRNPMLDLPKVERPSPHALLATALGAAGLLFTFVYRAPWFRETLRYTLQGLCLLPLFTAAIRYPRWGLMRILNLRSLSFVGTLSYSLYLVHHTVLDTLDRPFRGTHWLARPLVCMAISFAIAYTLWRFVEQPCAELRRRLSRGETKAVTGADASGASTG
jgi:peptidoglycan/LPS O-acetylase OafA/YrhL